MATAIDAPVRPELLEASDETIADAIQYADPMVLRALLYQLTGDPELLDIELRAVMAGFFEIHVPAREQDVAMIRHKGAEFLKAYRDSGAGPISVGPMERLATSMRLGSGEAMPTEEELGLFVEELALDPWARSLKWQAPPPPERLQDFSVTVIGAGMGGLNAALQLKRAGIPHIVIEKNAEVGGTWYENRYPGARVDTPSRSYTHIFGVDFGYPNPFCEAAENQKYFNWIADSFGLRENIVFNTEVRSLTWDDAVGMWEIRMEGPDGERVHRSRAVITAVGFLSRPNLPEFEGAGEFQGRSWHTARWPDGMDLCGKRVAVIGTGATGYQMIPELALQAEYVTVFQRTASWVCPVPGYRSPFPPQIGWLDRNLPFHTNFMRGGRGGGSWYLKMTSVDPDFDDPHATSLANRRARDACFAFLESKIEDPALLAAMTPPHPIWSARVIMVDPEYSILDAVQRDNVTLVTSEIGRVNATGVETQDGTQHDVDVIVYATGFRATDYLFPMTVTGRDGMTLDDLWAEDGARAYLGCMMPGFPNLWSLYGPNTNGGLGAASYHEMVTVYALRCIERLIVNGEKSVDVKEEVYLRYNRRLDQENSIRVWSNPRAHSYYWSKYGRSITQNPLNGSEMWDYLRMPVFEELVLR
jgi:4-hydroxyacetophenone monooxygenase